MRRQVANPWTIGEKKLLYLHVRFAGDAAPPTTTEEAEADLTEASNGFKTISYNQYSFTWTITPVLNLAQTADYYIDRRDQLLEDARAAALLEGYNYEEYDLEIVRHNVISGWMGGYGNIGRRGAWIQAAGSYIILHEIGHNLGLNHANFWDTSAAPSSPKISPPFPSGTNEGREGHPFDPDSLIGHQTIVGLGQSVEYGDPMDVMGGGDTPPQFNAIYKYQLGWLTPEQRHMVRQSGVYRLHGFDRSTTSPDSTYLIGIERPGFIQGGFNNYWIQFKGGPSVFPGIAYGVQIHARPISGETASTLLLDMTPGTESGQADATLPIGKTFSDHVAGIHITPLGTNESADYIDVAVQVGDFPENQPPTLELIAPALSIQPEEPIQLTATATDPDGDQLAYHWDFKNGDFSPNTNQVTVSWKNPGDYVVRCEVSDLRGGIAARHLIVRVGEVNTFRISGTVKDEEGNPVVGARVHNGRLFRNPGEGNHVFDFTDSDGAYILANLKPGSYTNGAYLPGYKIVRPTTEPFVIVDSDLSDANLQATKIPTLTVETSHSIIEEGAPDTHFIFTRSGPTNESLTVGYSLSGTAEARSDYADYFLPRVTFPAGSRSVILPLTSFADTQPEGEETVTLVVHYATETTRQIVDGDRTNEITFYYPGWELVPGPGTNFWAQTYPEFMPGKPATFILRDTEGTPDYIVSVHAGDLIAIENPLVETHFDISRLGNTAEPLQVHISRGGTATPGVDYESIPQIVIIPAGESSVRIPIIPIPDKAIEGEETIVLTISPDPGYEIDIAEATVRIKDDAKIELRLSLDMLQDGRVKLVLDGQAGQTHVLEQSLDLTSWVPFRTNLLFTSRLEVVLPNDSPQLFFRAYKAE